MINFINISTEEPYNIFKKRYDEASSASQKNIEAVAISSYDKKKEEVDSRFVNIKFIDEDNFIFFTNYNSPKSIAFQTNNQIGALFYWSSIDSQIRMKAKIYRTSEKYNLEYFKNRNNDKNALALSSNQSAKIDSYEDVLKKYQQIKKSENLKECPDFWGGFHFKPYYFEFWTGDSSRINKREVFEFKGKDWQKYFLEP
tara:strand:- start:228 stop:824 length:597 start_codon:yes stop_codon:yes gene_type:complete